MKSRSPASLVANIAAFIVVYIIASKLCGLLDWASFEAGSLSAIAAVTVAELAEIRFLRWREARATKESDWSIFE